MEDLMLREAKWPARSHSKCAVHLRDGGRGQVRFLLQAPSGKPHLVLTWETRGKVVIMRSRSLGLGQGSWGCEPRALRLPLTCTPKGKGLLSVPPFSLDASSPVPSPSVEGDTQSVSQHPKPKKARGCSCARRRVTILGLDLSMLGGRDDLTECLHLPQPAAVPMNYAGGGAERCRGYRNAFDE